MLITLKHRLAFLAVPKTGTTAIEAALKSHASISFNGMAAVKHMRARRFELMMRPYLENLGVDNIQTFAVMRDPIDYLQSWYFFRRRIAEANKRRQQNATRLISLEEFLEAFLSEDPPDYASVAMQSSYLCGAVQVTKKGGSAQPMVDLVFAYEKMDALNSFLEGRLRTKVEVERKNTSKREVIEIPAELRARLELRLSGEIGLHKRVLAGEFLPGSGWQRKRLVIKKGKPARDKEQADDLDDE